MDMSLSKLGDSEGQGSHHFTDLECSNSWGCKESDTIELQHAREQQNKCMSWEDLHVISQKGRDRSGENS